jgi:hypothetical protein
MQVHPFSKTHEDQSIFHAWREGVSQAAKQLPLKPPLLAAQAPELLPRFSAHYQRLKTLSRPVRRRLQRQWKRSLAGIALLMALGAQPALAATIPVRGDCNLIAAIRAANSDTARGGCPAGNGADTIVLPSNSTQTLTRVINTDYGATGLPLILSDITIDGNGSTIRRAGSAPRFRILAVARTGDLTLLDTTVTGGRTDSDGGGVLVRAFPPGGLTLTNATISDNFASENGGGIEGGQVTLTNSSISGNTARNFGGGIYGGVTATNSTISDNIGGGVDATENDARITRSTISDNTEFGIEAFFSDLDVIRSTISGNDGNGVSHFGGYATVLNSTISGNSGRGIAEGTTDEFAVLEVTHSTVTDNAEGGIVLFDGSATLSRSLISGNGEVEVARVVSEYTSITANDFNVFGFSGNARVEGFTPGPTDIVPRRRLNAILDPNLEDNGGPTETHALVPGSPAIDAVEDMCPPPATDQRGVSRRQDDVCDTGSFERRPNEPDEG